MTNSTLLNAIVGAIVTVLTSFVPLSPILGGGVAAYLEGGDRGDAILVGALAGLIAWIPLTPLLFLGLLIAPFDFGITFVLILFGLGFVALYLVGLSALGGFIAAYIMADPRFRRSRRDEFVQTTLSEQDSDRRD